jgi:peptidoglycan-associated lipoprotein
MKKNIWIVLSVVLAAVACKKGAQDIDTGGSGLDMYDPDGQDDASVGGPRTEEATGAMRDLILALRRVHFAFDVSSLTDDARDALTEAASSLNMPELSDVQLWVDGNTDERGTTEYNMSLGERRGQTVVKYLVSLGVDEKRLHVVSYGEENPLVSGSSEHAHAKNRRVDFRLKRGDVEFVLNEGQPVDDQGNPL